MREQTTLAAELERARTAMADRRDRALVGELCTGVLRWRAELDALIEAASGRRLAQIDDRALLVLRLAAYQIRHLDRIPDHAVVHESVDLVRELGAARAAGFVNAVLRQLLRLRAESVLPVRPARPGQDAATVRYLAVTLSHPEWLVRRWLRRYGFDATERWCLFNNQPPPVTLRAVRSAPIDQVRARLSEVGLDARPARYVADALSLEPGTLGQMPAAIREDVYVQDEGAQLIARAAAARPGERVLDVCAAPGGKTLVLASDLGLPAESRSWLVAGDRRRARLRVLAGLLRRAALSVPIVGLDALRPLPFGRSFDCVLLDAPCSGLGVLRREPDLKWLRRESDLERLAADERRMLERASALVRPGGRLVYATCSSEPEENGLVVEAFLREHPDFVLMSVPLPAVLQNAGGCLETTPVRHELDGYYAAVLARRAAA
jgi:16S rRNA (cytosine967-C5)-methyltransferase